jgi:hypothetical protein
MEEKELSNIEPTHIEISGNSLDGYMVYLTGDSDEELVDGVNIESHRFGKDLLGAIICAQKLQRKMLNQEKPAIFIVGFPDKHPNQTTLDKV